MRGISGTSIALCGVIVGLTAGGCAVERNVGSTCEDGRCRVELREESGIPCLMSTTTAEVLFADDVCIPRPLPRDEDGLTPCRLTWRIPAGLDLACADFPFAHSRELTDLSEVCEIEQLATSPSGLVDSSADGWFYDDFRDVTLTQCHGHDRQRIAVTAAAMPPESVEVRLTCVNALADVRDAAPALTLDAPVVDVGAQHCQRLEDGRATAEQRAERVGASCLPAVMPEFGFNGTETYLYPASRDECAGGVCLVYRLHGVPAESCEDVAAPCADCSPPPCAGPEEVAARAYCSCRCDAGGDPTLPECDCPDGFSCVDVVDEVAGPGIAGGYCVANTP